MNLNQVTVPSLDVVKSKEFYIKLGLKLIVESLPKYLRFECPDGDSTFSVHQVDELPRGSGTMVYFEVENVDEKVEEIESLGIQLKERPVNQSWLWREARLSDLDGNSIVLFQADTNRKNPPWRIK